MSKSNRKTTTRPMLERITKIHQRILAGCYPNTERLEKELQVSNVTVRRDIEYMRDRMNAPIEYDRTRHGFFYREAFQMAQYSLSPRDLQVLGEAKALLAHFAGTPVYEEACSVIDLLSAQVLNPAVSALAGRIAVPPRAKPILDEKIWDVICAGLETNCIIEFDYTGIYDDKPKRRTVRPYQLLIDGGECSLFGWSEERNGERLFSLHRIQNAVLTERTFELPDDIDFVSRCGGGKFGMFCGSKSERYKIELYDEARVWVKDCVWADDQRISEDGDATVLEFTSTQHGKIESWVLSCGANARPLAPPRLVSRWKEHIENMADKVSW